MCQEIKRPGDDFFSISIVARMLSTFVPDIQTNGQRYKAATSIVQSPASTGSFNNTGKDAERNVGAYADESAIHGARLGSAFLLTPWCCDRPTGCTERERRRQTQNHTAEQQRQQRPDADSSQGTFAGSNRWTRTACNGLYKIGPWLFAKAH
jgi:hypothetical protein